MEGSNDEGLNKSYSEVCRGSGRDWSKKRVRKEKNDAVGELLLPSNKKQKEGPMEDATVMHCEVDGMKKKRSSEMSVSSDNLLNKSIDMEDDLLHDVGHQTDPDYLAHYLADIIVKLKEVTLDGLHTLADGLDSQKNVMVRKLEELATSVTRQLQQQKQDNEMMQQSVQEVKAQNAALTIQMQDILMAVNQLIRPNENMDMGPVNFPPLREAGHHGVALRDVSPVRAPPAMAGPPRQNSPPRRSPCRVRSPPRFRGDRSRDRRTSPRRDTRSPRQSPCVFCGKNHMFYDRCKEVRRVSERLRIVSENHLCRRCLRRHDTPCTKTELCHWCRSPEHHSALCESDAHRDELARLPY